MHHNRIFLTVKIMIFGKWTVQNISLVFDLSMVRYRPGERKTVTDGLVDEKTCYSPGTRLLRMVLCKSF
jgi:hypothetical protein